MENNFSLFKIANFYQCGMVAHDFLEISTTHKKNRLSGRDILFDITTLWPSEADGQKAYDRILEKPMSMNFSQKITFAEVCY